MARGKQAETTAETGVAEKTAPADPIRYMDPEVAASLLAAKTAAGVSKPWGPFKKASTEIPERMLGSEFAILQPKAGATPEETWQNILVFCGGDHVAALDTFNSAYRLDNQKTLKSYINSTGEGETALGTGELQEISNRHTARATVRGKGGRGSAKARADRAEAKVAVAAASMEDMLRDMEALDPEKAAAYRARLEALNA